MSSLELTFSITRFPVGIVMLNALVMTGSCTVTSISQSPMRVLEGPETTSTTLTNTAWDWTLRERSDSCISWREWALRRNGEPDPTWRTCKYRLWYRNTIAYYENQRNRLVVETVINNCYLGILMNQKIDSLAIHTHYHRGHCGAETRHFTM